MKAHGFNLRFTTWGGGASLSVWKNINLKFCFINNREKAEKALQVIFMNGQETAVKHPDSKQSYTFNYDFSFCSVDECDPAFASQQTVYETLAKPLLLRALEGFNTCLFAYGQTGSGKSYT